MHPVNARQNKINIIVWTTSIIILQVVNPICTLYERPRDITYSISFTFFSVIDIVIYQVRQTLSCLYINFIDSMSSIRSSKTVNLNVENRSKLAPVSKSPTPDPKNRSVSGSRFMAEPYERPNQDRPKSNHSKSKFDSEMESMEKQLKLHKSKLCSCLEIYSMLQNSTQGQRCLQHNNTLSLYCLNQRRILCVNCLYGMHRHRSHKVVPLKDCMDQVYQDNTKLKFIIEEEIKKMDVYSKIADQNAAVLQTEMKKIIEDMEGEYKRKIDEITHKFQLSKSLLLDSFQPVINKCKSVKTAYDDFRFNVWKAFTLHSDQKPTDENEIMKQMLFVTIVDLCEFRNRAITKSELQSLSRRLKQHF